MLHGIAGLAVIVILGGFLHLVLVDVVVCVDVHVGIIIVIVARDAAAKTHRGSSGTFGSLRNLLEQGPHAQLLLLHDGKKVVHQCRLLGAVAGKFVDSQGHRGLVQS